MDIRQTYRKNHGDIRGIFLRKYPGFIFRQKNTLEKGSIPVFVFHSVTPVKLEEQLKYLADNNYKTVNADNLYEMLVRDKTPEEKTVVLTFDDGLGSLWSTAYPLLKKYGFVGISFLIPSLIEDDDECYPSLEDFWQRKVSMEVISKREEISRLCNWTEIRTMHRSGVIDFQSHSFFHCSVFTSEKLIGFLNPDSKKFLFQTNLNPLIFKNGKETLAKEENWGLPLYKWDANLAAKTRYMENETVSYSCMEYVKNNGGVNFFNKKDWETKLKTHWKNSCDKYERTKKFQSFAEREKDIAKDIKKSKERIEQELNKDVRHLCYPWYKGSKKTVDISREVGYVSNHWGVIKKRAINIIGDDPFYIRRINERYIFSLPGKGRKSLYKVLSKRIR